LRNVAKNLRSDPYIPANWSPGTSAARSSSWRCS